MKPRFQSILLPALFAGFAITSVHADPLAAGAQIGIDFGGVNADPGSQDPTNNFNLVSPSPPGPGSLAAGSLITTTNVIVDGVGFSWSATNPFFNNDDSIVIAGQPVVFNESNLTDWIGISNAAATTVPGVITLTFTGLNNALTYDVIVGAGFASDIADTLWASGSQSGLSDTSSGPNSFVTLLGLSTDGSGNLVITGTGTLTGGNRADIAVVSALHLTAVAPQIAATFQLVITPNGDDFDFSWDSQPGKVYDLLTSTDLATPIAEWPIYNDGVTLYQAIPATGTTTTLTAVPSSDPRRFFAIREYNAP